jgi:hypothetical protein
MDVLTGLYNKTILEQRVQDKFTRPLDAALSRSFTALHEFAAGTFHVHNRRVALHAPAGQYWQFCYWDSDNASLTFSPILNEIGAPSAQPLPTRPLAPAPPSPTGAHSAGAPAGRTSAGVVLFSVVSFLAPLVLVLILVVARLSWAADGVAWARSFLAEG